MTELQKAQQKIANQQKYIDELLVLIDTAQAGLRRAESTIKKRNRQSSCV